MLVLKGLVGLNRTVQLQLLQCYWLGHRLGLLWYWMVCLEMSRDQSVIFEIASKYCISDSFVDHDGCSISSKGFLPTVVDRMVIGVNFKYPQILHPSSLEEEGPRPQRDQCTTIARSLFISHSSFKAQFWINSIFHSVFCHQCVYATHLIFTKDYFLLKHKSVLSSLI